MTAARLWLLLLLVAVDLALAGLGAWFLVHAVRALDAERRQV